MTPRLGVSINGDQWLVGNQLRMTLPCLGNLGYGPFLAFGFGGNHLTFRSAARLDYQLWLDRGKTFALVPAVGAAALFYVPVGGFASFCERTGLVECYGEGTGLEVGGAIRYRSFSVDAFVGLGDLPVLTITAGVTFPLFTLGGD